MINNPKAKTIGLLPAAHRHPTEETMTSTDECTGPNNLCQLLLPLKYRPTLDVFIFYP